MAWGLTGHGSFDRGANPPPGRFQNEAQHLPCPNCGTRPVEEFVYGEIPVLPDEITDPVERDFDYGFVRNNPPGVQTEAWFHTYGCRRWLRMKRDTRTDRIIGTG